VTGAALAVKGIVVESQGKGQKYEILASEVQLVGDCRCPPPRASYLLLPLLLLPPDSCTLAYVRVCMLPCLVWSKHSLACCFVNARLKASR